MLHVSRPVLLPSARRGAALAAVVAAATVLAGCTSQSSGTQTSKQTKTLVGEAGAVQAVIADLSSRASSRPSDPKGICERDLSTTAQAQFAKTGGTCEKGVAKAIGNTDSLALDVKSVKVSTVSGTQQIAVAQVDTPDDIGTRSIILGRPGEKAKWTIVSFDSSLTPKGTTPGAAGSTPAGTSTGGSTPAGTSGAAAASSTPAGTTAK